MSPHRSRRVRPRTASLAVAACSTLLTAATVAAAASTVHVDRSNGSYAGKVWLVVSAADAAPSFVGVGIARLADSPLEASFALRPGADGAELGAVADLAALRGEGRTVVEVEVGPRAHDEVRHLVASWQAGEQEGTEPTQRIENLLGRVVRSMGLKSPYRSALSGPDPASYLRDLARINGGG